MPQPSPLVSVLLPARDAADTLGDAIASLERQTIDSYEVIAVDDGSQYETYAVLRAWAARDARVRVLGQSPLGIVAALECARRAARGAFLARMDADDIAEPQRLALQLQLAHTDPRLVAVGCRIEYFPRSAVAGGARRYEQWINALLTHEAIVRDLFVECPIAHPTFFLRAEAVAQVGGFRDVGWPEDYDLLLRLWAAGGRFAKVDRTLLRWRERPDRLSRTSTTYGADAFRRCKISALTRTLLRHRPGVVVWGAGPVGKAFAGTLRREGIAILAFIDLDPRKIGQHIYGAPVVAPETIDRFRGAFCVGAVGQAGARGRIRNALDRAGWRELEDYVAVA
ncbi:MAG: glycosyltransferase [Longimicrobiales bacterium]